MSARLDDETTRDIKADFEARQADLVEHGRQLVESGNFVPDKMFDFAAVTAYRTDQRERVERSGYCAARCECEQVVAPNGEVVCPHTFRECMRISQKEIIEAWSQIGL